MIRDSFFVAWANLKANRSRSILSMLGIIIGTASVILVVAMVNGSREATLSALSIGRSNMLTAFGKYSDRTNRFGTFRLDDVPIYQAIPGVKVAFPEVVTKAQVRGSIGRAECDVVSVDENYSDIYGIQLIAGRFIAAEEVVSRKRVCVITDKLAKQVFGFEYPIGQRLRVNGLQLEVVGLVKRDKGLTKRDINSDIFISYPAFFRIFPTAVIHLIQVRTEEGKWDAVKREMAQILTSDPGRADMYFIWDPRDAVAETEKWARGWMLQMALIAGISLLVGGVGLMNVMLTSVVERTHEVGLRKALGANAQMIMSQFVVESVVLSGLGGAAGVSVGMLLSYGVSLFSEGRLAVSVLPLSVIVSFLFSLITGVLFGLFPASKAAALSPVEALRYE